MQSLDVPASWKWTAITLMAVVGLIHLLEAPEYFQLATYLGVLFLANALGAAVAIGGIIREMEWGWLLGVIVAGGAIIAYFVSRAVGLPGLPMPQGLTRSMSWHFWSRSPSSPSRSRY